MLLPPFGFLTKNEKNTYQKIYSEGIKKIGVRKGCWKSHKMTRNWLRRFRNTKIKI